MGHMLGVIIALATSLAWAGSSTILKYLSSRINAVFVNTMRLWVGSVILLAVVILSGKSMGILQVPFWTIVIIAVSGILSNAAGDTVYIKSLSFLDVSRSYPISQSAFPVMTLVAAIFLLNESFDWFNILGSALVLAGIFMIIGKNKNNPTSKISGKGVALTLLAALLWASGAIALKIGLTKTDPFLAAAIRDVASALVLTGLVFGRKSEDRLKLSSYGRRNLILVACAGLLTYGLGAVGYVTAIQLIGAGKTVFLSASAPIFVLPLSVIFLKERLSPLSLAGVFVSVAGICLIAL
jgi:drug/metabolite transporter (DMT)-like permease